MDFGTQLVGFWIPTWVLRRLQGPFEQLRGPFQVVIVVAVVVVVIVVVVVVFVAAAAFVVVAAVVVED